MATGNFDPLMARGVRHGRLQYEVQPATPGASLRGLGPPPDRSVMWKSTRWPSLKEDAPTTSLACKNTSGRPSWEMKPYRLRASNHFTTPVAYQPPFLERVPRTVPGAQTRRGRECPPNPHHSSTLAGPCSWDLSGSGASGFKSAAPFGYPSIVDQEGRWHVEFRYDGPWAAQTKVFATEPAMCRGSARGRRPVHLSSRRQRQRVAVREAGPPDLRSRPIDGPERLRSRPRWGVGLSHRSG